MKNINSYLLKLLVSSLIIFTNISLYAAAGEFGAGFILGDPTGLTGKYYVSGSDALDFGIGATSHDGLYLYGDYLRHFQNVFPINELTLYVGFGAGFHHHEKDENRNDRDDEYNSLECRVPVGLEYTFIKAPLGIFIEMAPALRIAPDIESDIRGGLGLRYYF